MTSIRISTGTSNLGRFICRTSFSPRKVLKVELVKHVSDLQVRRAQRPAAHAIFLAFGILLMPMIFSGAYNGLLLFSEYHPGGTLQFPGPMNMTSISFNPQFWSQFDHLHPIKTMRLASHVELALEVAIIFALSSSLISICAAHQRKLSFISCLALRS